MDQASSSSAESSSSSNSDSEDDSDLDSPTPPKKTNAKVKPKVMSSFIYLGNLYFTRQNIQNKFLFTMLTNRLACKADNSEFWKEHLGRIERQCDRLCPVSRMFLWYVWQQM